MADFYAAQPHVRHVIVISNYAKAWTVSERALATGKVVTLGHGIDPAECALMLPKVSASDVPQAAARRDPWQVLYTSSWDRGLEVLIEAWPRVYRAVGPRARLVITCGRGPMAPSAVAQLAEMRRSMNTVVLYNVSDHGMSLLYASSGVWAHLCTGVELFCTSAVRTQCNGAVPVVIPCMAVQGTVKFGVKTSREQFGAELAALLLHRHQQEVLRAEMGRYRYSTWRELTETMASWFDERAHTRSRQQQQQALPSQQHHPRAPADDFDAMRWRGQYRAAEVRLQSKGVGIADGAYGTLLAALIVVGVVLLVRLRR